MWSWGVCVCVCHRNDDKTDHRSILISPSGGGSFVEDVSCVFRAVASFGDQDNVALPAQGGVTGGGHRQRL